MKITKDNKGISLVVLIITIIVIMILAGVTIYNSTEDIDKSNEQIAFTELQEVKHFVGESYLNYLKTKNNNFLVGTKVQESELNSLISSLHITLINIPNTYDKTKEAAYYRLNPTNLESIGVKNSKDTYIVNYVTGEVINETKLKTYSGDVLYTYIRNEFNTNDVTALNKNLIL